MPRPFHIVLIAAIVFLPFTVFAQEELTTTTPEVVVVTETSEATATPEIATSTEITEAVSTSTSGVVNPTEATDATSTPNVQVSTTTEIYMPIYIFGDKSGGILGITPISEEAFVWVYAPNPEKAETSSTTATSSLFENSNSTSTENLQWTPLGVLVLSWGASMGTSSDGSEGVVGVDASGKLAQLASYYPFGEMRLNQKLSATFDEKKKFIGQTFDDTTSLSYLNARYYDGHRGQFASQDPVSANIATMGKQDGYIIMLNQTPVMIDQTAILSDPQLLNFYSYSENNPVTKSDPSGKCGVWCVAVGLVSPQVAYAPSPGQEGQSNNKLEGGITVAAFAAPGGASKKLGAEAGNLAGKAMDGGMSTVMSISDHALKRMEQRGVSMEQVQKVITDSKPFQYLHDGIEKVGYYDSAAKVFVAQVKESKVITTVINNVKSQYVNNLKKNK